MLDVLCQDFPGAFRSRLAVDAPVHMLTLNDYTSGAAENHEKNSD